LELAALCVSNCVAEAYDSAGPTELRGLLITARGAAAELQSMTAIISERPKAARLREPLLQVRTCAESCFRQLGGWKHAVENPSQNKRPAGEAPNSGSHQGQSNPGARA